MCSIEPFKVDGELLFRALFSYIMNLCKQLNMLYKAAGLWGDIVFAKYFCNHSLKQNFCFVIFDIVSS